MDSRAKQRLTGAIILVALFVLLVPELLTGPRDAHPPSDEDSAAGLRQYTIDLDSQQGAPSTTAAPGDSSIALPPVAAPMNPAPERAQPGEAAAPEVAPAPSTNPVTPSAPTSQPAAPATPPARTDTPRAAASQRTDGGKFIVQLGSFSRRSNADQLVRDMTAKGFTAYVAPITSNGRELFRVRVGPVRDRAAAEALAAQLKREGQSGTVMPIP